MNQVLRKIAALLPRGLQNRLIRWKCSAEIALGRFVSPEPEFALLDRWIKSGDVVIDVGANIGHYTLRFSDIVGSAGRVIALEPIIDTFSILASNVSGQGLNNVTLINACASESFSIMSMHIPYAADGLRRLTRAALTPEGGELSSYCVPLDSLCGSLRIALVKIDAEGHDLNVIYGLDATLKRDLPTVIIENQSDELIAHLRKIGYEQTKLPGSPNLIFTHAGTEAK